MSNPLFLATSRLMVMVLGVFALLLPSALVPPLRADEGKSPSPAKKELPRSRPEQQGISSAAILSFVEEADKKIEGMHSFMLVRHGNVVAEGWWAPYDAKTRHEMYSLSKSFTSTAVGLAIADGKLSLDDPVLKFFPDDAPADPSNNLKSMRVRDLLCMSTGHQTEPRLAASTQPWAKTFLAHPVPNKPGTHFLYNTAATYMQSAIVQKATGKTVLEYLGPRLFEPLGIDSPTWGTSPQGITLGGYGLNIRTEDIARFGQLFLQKGKWNASSRSFPKSPGNGQQLVPAAWVEAATSKQTSNGSSPSSDWDQGYGFQFWRSRHGAYRGDGAFGQYCIVMPEQDAVVAITSGVKDMQAVLNLVWDKLLPAMKADTLSADDEANSRLQTKLASLMVPVQKGPASVQLPKEVSGKLFTFSANDQKLEQLGLEFGSDGNPATLIAKFKDSAEQRIPCGNNEWKKSRVMIGGSPEQNAAVSGAWTADSTYTAKVCLYETPFLITLKLDFSKDQLRFDSSQNVSFGPAKKPQLVGERK